jgi:hypothetical protein
MDSTDASYSEDLGFRYRPWDTEQHLKTIFLKSILIFILVSRRALPSFDILNKHIIEEGDCCLVHRMMDKAQKIQ